ncbi:hypothetical protein NMY22_g6284 [Coprinellus aureogranulatus]|nr:hypothetical protein NMY22_g6284 [Coprinellus aureogranulatus]
MARPLDEDLESAILIAQLQLEDSPTARIDSIFDSAVQIIHAALKSKKGAGRILVHCQAGVSRSPAIVTGYLMKRNGLTLEEALGQVIRARPQALPNPGFLQQLKEMEVELQGESTLEFDELPRREADRLALFDDVASA